MGEAEGRDAAADEGALPSPASPAEAAAALLRSAMASGASLAYDVRRTRDPGNRARLGRMRSRVAATVSQSVDVANGYEIQTQDAEPAPKPASRYSREYATTVAQSAAGAAAAAAAESAMPSANPMHRTDADSPTKPPPPPVFRRRSATVQQAPASENPTPRAAAPPAKDAAPWEGIHLPPVNPAHWKGNYDSEQPDFNAVAPPELRRFLLQAGAPAKGNVWARLSVLAEEAAEWAPLWECRRVMACATAEQVLRLLDGWDEVGTSTVTKDGRRIAAKLVDDDEREKRIRAAFRKVSMVVHPDKNKSPAAPEAMARVVQAQKLLREAKRPVPN